MKQKLAIYGAGTIGSMLLTSPSYKEHLKKFDVVGFIDDEKKGRYAGIEILGGAEKLPDLRKNGVENIIVGFSTNPIKRLDVCEHLEKLDFSFPSFTGELPMYTKIGKGVYIDISATMLGTYQHIDDFCVIGSHTTIESEAMLKRGVIVSPHSFVGARSEVGEATVLLPYSGCKPETKIGKHCIVGPQVFLRKDVKNGARVVSNREK
ncbi:MAG TPA: hypothetical protein VKE88_02615 [Candidatus Nanoarchaeia archaeon]|nr:hypothetical protein [Candidatus Nanoarchaeia archaeon]